jgi:glycosyltransferase involved in cell wall biosynthesis
MKRRYAMRATNRSSEAAAPADTLVVVPIFNEVFYVRRVLRAIKQYATDILVVDDGSTDGTSGVVQADASLRLITHETNLGYGRSLIDAFRFAAHNGFDWVITMDCDDQHEPSYLPHFFRAIEENDADVISGTRYAWNAGCSVLPPPPERVAINREITRILNLHLRVGLTDAFCGFKAYRTEALRPLQLTEAGYAMPLQFWVQAHHANLRIREIPVPLIYHDPRRRFSGALEDPVRRRFYYLQILEKELGYNVQTCPA